MDWAGSYRLGTGTHLSVIPGVRTAKCGTTTGRDGCKDLQTDPSGTDQEPLRLEWCSEHAWNCSTARNQQQQLKILEILRSQHRQFVQNGDPPKPENEVAESLPRSIAEIESEISRLETALDNPPAIMLIQRATIGDSADD